MGSGGWDGGRSPVGIGSVGGVGDLAYVNQELKVLLKT